MITDKLYKILTITLQGVSGTISVLSGVIVLGGALAYTDASLSWSRLVFLALGLLVVLVALQLARRQYEKRKSSGLKRCNGLQQQSNKSVINRFLNLPGAVVSLFTVSLIGALLSFIGGAVITALALLTISATLVYRGQYPLALRGAGELLASCCGGIMIVCATYYIQVGELSVMAPFVGLAPGVLIFANVLIRNLQNFDEDTRLGNRTLPVILGRYKTIVSYKVLVFVSYLVPFILAISGSASGFVLLPLCTLPMARSLTLKAECDLTTNLKGLVASSRRLTIVFCVMFALGLVYHF